MLTIGVFDKGKRLLTEQIIEIIMGIKTARPGRAGGKIVA